MGAGIEAKPLKTLRLGTDTASICVKIGVFLWCFRNSGEFLQQGCINTTPAHEVSHFYHTPSRTCTRAHTHARHAYAQAHTHTQAQPRERVPFPHEKQNQNESPKRITPKRQTNHPETPRCIAKPPQPRKKINFLFVCFQCFNIFIR
tara:strand:- start:3048 stop:3488 length:441 start_codon:yes stop_codon:yes gene_type:complete